MEEIIFKYFTELDNKQKEQIINLFPLYKEWNDKRNVISRKDIENLYLHHVLHSLAIAKFIKSTDIKLDNKTKILDLGTGGGFPGIPLAIFFKDISFTLVDSIGKKVKVAQEIVNALNLTNVVCVNARAENINDNFNYVVSRAVTDLQNFIPWVKNKYTNGIIYLKGGDVVEEVNNALSKNNISVNKLLIKEISDWFTEDFFINKYVIYVRK